LGKKGSTVPVNLVSPGPEVNGASEKIVKTSADEPSTPAPEVGHPYAAVPFKLLMDPRLKPCDVVVLAGLQKWAWKAFECYPALSSIVAATTLSERTVQRSLTRLKALGLIREERTAENATGRKFVLCWMRDPAYRPSLPTRKAPPAKDAAATWGKSPAPSKSAKSSKSKTKVGKSMPDGRHMQRFEARLRAAIAGLVAVGLDASEIGVETGEMTSAAAEAFADEKTRDAFWAIEGKLIRALPHSGAIGADGRRLVEFATRARARVAELTSRGVDELEIFDEIHEMCYLVAPTIVDVDEHEHLKGVCWTIVERLVGL
jgi:hypothetical protein